jgi:hypothetical protein
MPHPLPADFEVGYFYTATVADNPLVPDGFKLAAVTFPFLSGTEDTLTKESVLFRTEGSVVDSLRFFYFPIGPAPDYLWGSQTDHNGIEILYIPHYLLLVKSCAFCN